MVFRSNVAFRKLDIYFSRFIWSATIDESLTFSIHDNEGEEVYTVTSNKTNGDSEIINDSKMNNIRNHQFFVSIDDDDPIMIHEQELKIGANYQLVYVNKSTTNVN